MFGLAAALLAAAGPSRAALTNSECRECHSSKGEVATNAAGRVISLFVDPNPFKASVHSQLNCKDCHQDIKDLPHPEQLAPAKCAGCHAAAGKQYAASIHGVSKAMGASAAAGCADCHGSHDIRRVKDAESPVFKMNLARTCATCHNNAGVTHEYRMRHPDATAQYTESIHGRALLKMGLIVAPSCNECHGIHDIRRAVDRSSPINHLNVAKTCGKCHTNIETTYSASVHGQLLAKGDGRGPVCTDCHTAHQIESPTEGRFKALSDQRCGLCHKDRLEYYHETYHGKAMVLGRPNVAADVAACYDCHGHHDVLPPSNPSSYLSPARIVQTCRQCHKKATPSFTRYIPHANPLDRAHYPALHLTFVLMTGLLLGVFGFFGLHTLFWIFRSGYLYWHDSKTFREAKINAQRGDEWFTRFLPYERMLHIMLVTSFLLLTLTGMPLKFYYTHWAKVLFNILGGAPVARSLHHFGALLMLLCFSLHCIKLLVMTWKSRVDFRDPETGKWNLRRIMAALFGPDSLAPTLQDWRDFIAHQKWFFGKGPRPQFDRWTYWEKFDYFAVFWGMFAIGASGLIMWYPIFFSRFMPGWVINIALIVHSDEALLAAGFIFTVHFFNTHFRLEKFPMDTVIFSGRISKNEMLHERMRWYNRLVAEQRIEQNRAGDEWYRWQNIARTFGYGFFGLGLILLGLIVYAMFSHLGKKVQDAETPPAASVHPVDQRQP